ncbi:MAG: 16S rRNA (cytosine(1402)-N(4))-methyltransferase RsmH [Dethiobacter sp.]|nr:16S rRNA (cytosine(1402)-N(4))-methyltransferase RsmH [Dethiobacter sp.]
MPFAHEPVLLAEVLAVLEPHPGETFVDGTVGGGGHSLEIAKRIAPGGKLVAIDRDGEALVAARRRLQHFSEETIFVQDNFCHLKKILLALGMETVDGVLLDVGVSSHQLDEEERGFSYHTDALLDMRMDRRGGSTAADLVNTLAVGELARIIRDFGEELWARRIAEFIVARRQRSGPLRTTGELVEAVKAAIPARARRHGKHPARRTFQALRVAVNDELSALERAVSDALDCLKPGGRLAVITFHSLEDRIVKKIFQRASNSCQCPPGLPQCGCGWKPLVKMLTGKALRPTEAEVARNPRARSAKLRVVVKF